MSGLKTAILAWLVGCLTANWAAAQTTFRDTELSQDTLQRLSDTAQMIFTTCAQAKLWQESCEWYAMLYQLGALKQGEACETKGIHWKPLTACVNAAIVEYTQDIVVSIIETSDGQLRLEVKKLKK